MNPIRSFRDLEVWQLAMTLAVGCFQLTAGFPREEMYGMSQQIRRAATSITANIAEGYGRDQTGYFVQFLKIALGSTRELESHLLLVERLELATNEAIESPLGHCERISKMLRSLIRKLEAG